MDVLGYQDDATEYGVGKGNAQMIEPACMSQLQVNTTFKSDLGCNEEGFLRESIFEMKLMDE